MITMLFKVHYLRSANLLSFTIKHFIIAVSDIMLTCLIPSFVEFIYDYEYQLHTDVPKLPIHRAEQRTVMNKTVILIV